DHPTEECLLRVGYGGAMGALSNNRSGGALHEKSGFRLRSRRKHKAWGVSPRNLSTINFQAGEAGDRTSAAKMPTNLQRTTVAHFMSSKLHYFYFFLGLRPRLYACACSTG